MVSIIYSTFFNSTERYLDPRMKVKINFSVKIILAVVPVPFSLYEYVQKATQYSMKKAGYFQYKLYLPPLEKGSDQLIVTLFLLYIYP